MPFLTLVRSRLAVGLFVALVLAVATARAGSGCDGPQMSTQPDGMTAGLSAARDAGGVAVAVAASGRGADEVDLRTSAVQSGGTNTVIFSDNFEGSFPGQWHLMWSVTAGTDTTLSWGRCTNRAAGGAASLWCAGGGSHAHACGTTYAPNEGTWAIYGPFSLADATAAAVDFDLWLASQNGADYVYTMVSTDGAYYYGGFSLAGSTGGGWVHRTVNLAAIPGIAPVGAPQVWVALVFQSNASTQAEGAYIDNVVIQKTTAAPCTYGINAASQSFPAAGGTGTIGVTASASSCAWTAASNDAWIQVTSGASGTGNGSVGFSVTANSGAARSGTITAAGQTFTVNQAAGGGSSYPYTYWLQVISHTSGAGGTQWRSDVGIFDRSATAANVGLILYTGSGTLSRNQIVAGNAQTIETDLAGQLGLTSGSGALEVLSTEPLVVTSRTYNLAASGFTYGQGYDGVVSSDGLGAGASAYLTQLSQTGAAGQVGTTRTNIAVTNTGAAPASVTVAIFTATGAQVWSDTRSYDPGEFYQYQEPYRLGAGLTNVTAGYAVMTVNSGTGVISTASVIDNGSGDPTTRNATP